VEQPSSTEENTMLTLSIFVGSLFAITSFFVGGVIGWTAREYLLYNQEPQPTMHPEMYDEDGNVLPDSLISFRFTYDDDTDEED
jgi:hypothetical protein|tara:strand:+ start:613 stop:864 length:252 start_codon:yes stop_codon:yes gene_type:complete